MAYIHLFKSLTAVVDSEYAAISAITLHQFTVLLWSCSYCRPRGGWVG